MKKILDVTCGSRSIWFNKKHPLAIYFDRRDVEYEETFGKTPRTRHIIIHPDVVGDFTDLPFEDNTFSLVVFDPPHRWGLTDSWFLKRYGTYDSKEEMLRNITEGFAECMRVLKPDGVLVFKWSEVQIPTPEIIKAFGSQPLFGHRSGKKSNTNWLCFMKADILISSDNKCVACGETIPEGRQVCPGCEGGKINDNQQKEI